MRRGESEDIYAREWFQILTVSGRNKTSDDYDDDEMETLLILEIITTTIVTMAITTIATIVITKNEIFSTFPSLLPVSRLEYVTAMATQCTLFVS